jgi:iron(III)-salmochelin esterase
VTAIEPSASLAPSANVSVGAKGAGPTASVGLAATTAVAESVPAAAKTELPASLLTWRFEDARFGPMVVVVRVPERQPEQRFGVLFAYHGRGESLKGPERGARGWLDDYKLEHAVARLRTPPLTADDFGGDITPERLAEHNRELQAQPYRGVIVVMPFLPDALGRDQVFWAGPALGEQISRELVPRILAETPAVAPGAQWGVDGVSMGGRAALAVGFNRPQLFGWVGGLQAAVDEKELSRFVDLALRARGKNPEQRLRLLTSDGDYYLDVTLQLHRRLERADVQHTLVRVRGGHNYQFNRGPGVYEMLLDADRALSPRSVTGK